ncbi:unnamed protein product [Adineta ricciae]|uniref:Uncharacterized protein n=1 Tax=Adineta ricciae TaxID=249248 RepID=A0A815NCJ4_ADIRI|nr:unnamed protein product [Adineta ricciae]
MFISFFSSLFILPIFILLLEKRCRCINDSHPSSKTKYLKICTGCPKIDALKINKILQTLSLGHNGIGDEGTRHLSDAFKINQTINAINLHTNQIGDQGASCLSDTLMNNQINDQGACHLADALKVNETILVLKIGFNLIAAQTIDGLPDDVKRRMTLQM